MRIDAAGVCETWKKHLYLLKAPHPVPQPHENPWVSSPTKPHHNFLVSSVLSGKNLHCKWSLGRTVNSWLGSLSNQKTKKKHPLLWTDFPMSFQWTLIKLIAFCTCLSSFIDRRRWTGPENSSWAELSSCDGQIWIPNCNCSAENFPDLFFRMIKGEQKCEDWCTMFALCN